MLLKQRGPDVTVYESAFAIQPVSAGMVTANNTMQTYRKAAIQHKVEETGYKVSYLKITDEQVDTLSVVERAKYEYRYWLYNVAIECSDLSRYYFSKLNYNISKNKIIISSLCSIYNARLLLKFY